MIIVEEVLDKIRKEDERVFWNEFGGYLIIEDGKVTDIVFDVKKANPSHVTFGTENIMKLPKEKREKTRGWFHRHSVFGLSQEDIMTTMKLTKFWGECYTLILQPAGKLLTLRTIEGTDFLTRNKLVIETERGEIGLYDGKKRPKKGFFGRFIQEPAWYSGYRGV